jgi:hypothetical protein
MAQTMYTHMNKQKRKSILLHTWFPQNPKFLLIAIKYKLVMLDLTQVM